MIRQTIAIFVDAYRELNSKKLFWFVLGLSALFVGGIASVGITDNGFSILWWKFDQPLFNAKIIPRAVFYKFWFFTVGFKVWLTWAATILALVSTAGMIPEFVGSGAIELSLCKPIGRVRLFLTKYLAGLLFVAMQVSIFSVMAFRGCRVARRRWVPRLFLAIPLVLLMFSYLFSFCALIGFLTRSTDRGPAADHPDVAVHLPAPHRGNRILLTFKVRQDQSVAIRQNRLDRKEAALTALKNQPFQRTLRRQRSERTRSPPRRRSSTTRAPKLESARNTQRNLNIAHSLTYAFKTVLPKTPETIDLLGRTLLTKTSGAASRSRPTTAWTTLNSARPTATSGCPCAPSSARWNRSCGPGRWVGLWEPRSRSRRACCCWPRGSSSGGISDGGPGRRQADKAANFQGGSWQCCPPPPLIAPCPARCPAHARRGCARTNASITAGLVQAGRRWRRSLPPLLVPRHAASPVADRSHRTGPAAPAIVQRTIHPAVSRSKPMSTAALVIASAM
jgi:hypothetical protein